MIALDTNILVYAHRRDSPFHSAALDILESLGNGKSSWAIPWPCLHEFLSIVTHPRIYNPPTPIGTALTFLGNWLASPTLTLISEGDAHFQHLAELARKAKTVGPRIHDARIAALCIASGVDVLYTADRDFSRYPALKTRNPLVARHEQ